MVQPLSLLLKSFCTSYVARLPTERLFLSWKRIVPKKRDDEINTKVRLEVVMRLRAPSLIGDDSRIARVCCGGSGAVLSCIRGRTATLCRVGVTNPAAARPEPRTSTSWYLRHRQRDLPCATRFRQWKSAA